MGSHVTVDRLQFALTSRSTTCSAIRTMGLALFVAWLKTVSYLGGERRRLWLQRKSAGERASYDGAAHFWAKIIAVQLRRRRGQFLRPRAEGRLREDAEG